MKKKIIIMSVIIGLLLTTWFVGVKPSQDTGTNSSLVENNDTTNTKNKVITDSPTKEEKMDSKETIKSQQIVKIPEKESSNKTNINKEQAEKKALIKEAETSVKQQVAKKETMTDKDKTDQYVTKPVPEGKPKPVELEKKSVNKKESFTIKVEISCETLISNIDLLDTEKHDLVPENGIILPLTEVTAYEGESAFDVLARETKKAKIHMEYVNTPLYNSAYIEGINNLYEFDAGELSGWMYKVNDWFPNYGSSRYKLQENDVIEWVYTCDLGRDVGSDLEATQK